MEGKGQSLGGRSGVLPSAERRHRHRSWISFQRLISSERTWSEGSNKFIELDLFYSKLSIGSGFASLVRLYQSKFVRDQLVSSLNTLEIKVLPANSSFPSPEAVRTSSRSSVRIDSNGGNDTRVEKRVKATETPNSKLRILYSCTGPDKPSN